MATWKQVSFSDHTHSYVSSASPTITGTATFSGKVDIGTAQSGYQLNVQSSAYGGSGRFANSYASGTAYGVIAQSEGACTTGKALYLYCVNATSNNYALHAEAGDVWIQSGKLGIGTANPAKTVHIYRTDANGRNIILDASNVNPSMAFYNAGTEKALIYLNQTNDDLQFSVAGSSRLTLNTSGNAVFAGLVGIGCTPADTNSTNDGLDIKYNTYAMWQTHGDSADERAWGFKNSYADAGKFALVSSDADDNVLHIPVTTWDKDGNATFSGAVTMGGELQISNASGAGTRLEIEPGTAGNDIGIRAEAHSGAYPDLNFIVGNAERLKLDNSGNATFAGTVQTTKLGIGLVPQSDLHIWKASGESAIQVDGGEGGVARIMLNADQADDNADFQDIYANTDGSMAFRSYSTGGWVNRLHIASDSHATFAGGLTVSGHATFNGEGIRLGQIYLDQDWGTIMFGAERATGTFKHTYTGRSWRFLYNNAGNDSTLKIQYSSTGSDGGTITETGNEAVEFSTTGATFAGEILSNSNNSSNLGSSSVRWANLYCAGVDVSGGATVAGTLNNNDYIRITSSSPDLYLTNSTTSANGSIFFTNNNNAVHWANQVNRGLSDGSLEWNRADGSSNQMSLSMDGYLRHQGIQDHVANTMPQPYYHFDGVDDYIDTGDTFQSTFRSSFSISAMVKLNDGQAGELQTIFGLYDTTGDAWIQLGILTDGKIRFCYGPASGAVTLDTAFEFDDGEVTWQHIVAVGDEVADTLSVYVNGVLLPTTASTSGLDWTDFATARFPYIGARNTGGSVGEELGGSIQQLGVYNLALSATEVKELYSGASVPFKYKGANQTAVADEDFASGTGGWVADWQASVAQDSGRLKASYTHADGNIKTGTLLTKGKRYRVTMTIETETTAIELRNGHSLNGDLLHTVAGDATETFSEEFTANYVDFWIDGGSGGNNMWMDNFSVVQIGAVAEYDGSSATGSVWYDKSGNNLDGEVSGASLENKVTALVVEDRVHISSSTSDAQNLVLQQTTNSDDQSANIAFHNAGGINVAMIRGSFIDQSSNHGQLKFYTNDGGGNELALTINKDQDAHFGGTVQVADINGKQGAHLTVDSDYQSDYSVKVNGVDFAGSGKATFSGDVILAKTAPKLTLKSTKDGTWDDEEVISELEFQTSDSSGITAPWDVGNIKMVVDTGTPSETGVATVSGSMAFYTSAYNTASTEAMRIIGSGKIGIGETLPVGKLTIRDDSATSTALHIKNNNQGVGRYSDIVFSYEVDGSHTASSRIRVTNQTTVNGSTDLQFKTTTAAYSEEFALVLDNVQKAHFYGDVATAGTLYANNVSDGRIYVSSKGTGDSGHFMRGESTRFTMNAGTGTSARIDIGGANKFEINSSGNATFAGNISTPQIDIDDWVIKDNIIAMDTADGSDNKEMYICAGGAAGDGRGSYIDMTGNDYGSWGGLINIVAGQGTYGGIKMTTGGVNRFELTSGGTATFGGEVRGTKFSISGNAYFDESVDDNFNVFGASGVKFNTWASSAWNNVLTLDTSQDATFAGAVKFKNYSGTRVSYIKNFENDTDPVDNAQVPTEQEDLIASYFPSPSGASSMSFLVSKGGEAPKERMRLTRDGMLFIKPLDQTTSLKLHWTTNTTPAVYGDFATFYNNGTDIGGIETDGSNTYYAKTSDYRLKENIADITDGVDRIKQLQPRKFSFKSDANSVMKDGFLAHEVMDIVPQAVTGLKDGIDDDGNPKYQRIDQSNLVPLLVQAVKELSARIEELEAK